MNFNNKIWKILDFKGFRAYILNTDDSNICIMIIETLMLDDIELIVFRVHRL